MDEKSLTYVTFYHKIFFFSSWVIKNFYTLISNSDYIGELSTSHWSVWKHFMQLL